MSSISLVDSTVLCASPRSDLADEPGADTQRILALFPDQACYQPANVSDLDDIERLVQWADDWGQGIDVLFNNAAVFDLAPLLESDVRMYQKIFDVNVKGAFFVLQGVAQTMVDRGTRGSIINMASQAGRRGEALVAALLCQ